MLEERSGFSLASVLLSFLMIAGGVSAALLGLKYVRIEGISSEHLLYAAFGAGGFVGGWFAARASRGSTVLEPAIGAVLVVGTCCGLLMTTEVGRALWRLAQDQVTRYAIFVGGATLVGALVGAWISERILGASTRSAIPWVLYVALAVIGGCCIAFIAAVAIKHGRVDASSLGESIDNDRMLRLLTFVGIGLGCLVAGLASGASARTKVSIAAFLGAAGGVVGFLVFQSHYVGPKLDEQTIALSIAGAGGGVLALLASAAGWAAVGKRA